MARVVKEADERRSEILDTAHALFMQHGYSATSVQQIIDAIGIAKGTFYHHFRSKAGLLDALVERFTQQAAGVVLPIVDDPQLQALDKLNRLFHTVGGWKATQRSFLVPVLRATRMPQNLRLRQGMEQRSLQLMRPWLARIVTEGVDQAVFDVYDAELAAELLLNLQVATGNTLGDLVLEPDKVAALERARRLVIAHDQAVARILGAPEGSFHMVELDALDQWFE